LAKFIAPLIIFSSGSSYIYPFDQIGGVYGFILIKHAEYWFTYMGMLDIALLTRTYGGYIL